MAAIVPANSTAHISLLTGEFRARTMERRFRSECWDDWARQLRVSFTLGGLFFFLLGFADYLALGPGPAFDILLFARLLVLVGAGLTLLLVNRHPRRIPLFDNLVSAEVLLTASVYCLIVALDGQGLLFDALTSLAMVFSLYIFVPNRPLLVIASGLYASITFLTAGLIYCQYGPAELLLVAILLIFVNMIGTLTALRMQFVERREFIQRLVLKHANEQLRHEVRERRHAEEVAAYHVAFDDLVTELSARLIRLDSEQLDAGIDDALRAVGEFTDVDRSYLFQLAETPERIRCTHEWCRPGISPEIDNLQDIAFDDLGWLMPQLQDGRAVHIPRVADLPEQAASEREHFQVQAIQSLVVVPLIFRGRFMGIVGLDSVHSEKTWHEDTVALLSVFGQMLISALHRRSNERILAERNEALEQSNAHLLQSIQEVRQFTYLASHDLQEPLRSINGFAALLRKHYHGRLDAKADEWIEYLIAGTDRMSQVIQDVLRYSKLSNGSQPMATCSLAETLEKALSNLQVPIHDHGVTVSRDSLPTLRCDRSQIINLLQHLIDNAIKFRGEDPLQVHISAQRQNGDWLIGVHDNGIGIALEHRERIFEIFRRLHGMEHYAGTGIGLALCKRIVEHHGGRIWVENNDNGGSSFYFTLPAAASATQAVT